MSTTLVADGLHNAFPGMMRRWDNGDIWLTYRVATDHDAPGANGIIKRFISTNKGVSWGSASTHLTVTGRDIRVCFPRQLRSGRIVETYTHRDTTPNDHTWAVRFSDDGGSSWTDATSCPQPCTKWNFVEGPVIELATANTLLVAIYCNNTDEPELVHQYVYKSTDGGANWTQLSEIASGGSDDLSSGFPIYGEPWLVRLGGTNILALYRGNLRAFWKLSANSGLTWGSENILTQVNQRPMTILLPDGYLLMATGKTTDGSTVYMISTTIMSATSWGSLVTLDADPACCYVDASLVAEDTNLIITWSTQHLPGHTVADLKVDILSVKYPSVGWRSC